MLQHQVTFILLFTSSILSPYNSFMVSMPLNAHIHVIPSYHHSLFTLRQLHFPRATCPGRLQVRCPLLNKQVPHLEEWAFYLLCIYHYRSRMVSLLYFTLPSQILHHTREVQPCPTVPFQNPTFISPSEAPTNSNLNWDQACRFFCGGGGGTLVSFV